MKKLLIKRTNRSSTSFDRSKQNQNWSTCMRAQRRYYLLRCRRAQGITRPPNLASPCTAPTRTTLVGTEGEIQRQTRLYVRTSSWRRAAPLTDQRSYYCYHPTAVCTTGMICTSKRLPPPRAYVRVLFYMMNVERRANSDWW